MITITDSQRNSLKITEKLTYLVRLFYGPTADNTFVALASGKLPKEWVDIEYKPMFPKNGKAKASGGSEYRTAKIQTGKINLVLSNGQYLNKRLSDLIYDSRLGTGNDTGFFTRNYEIRFHVEGATTWDECLPFSAGVIGQPSHTDTTVTFPLTDQTQVNNILIPKDFMTQDDAIQGFIPESSLNMPKPELYGTLHNPINYYSDNSGRVLPASGWSPVRDSRATPMLDMGGGFWFVANHVCKAPDWDNGDSIWAWDEDRKRLMELLDWQIFQNTSAGFIIERTGDTFFDFRRPYVDNAGGAGDWGDITNLFDGDISTGVSVTILNGTGPQIKLCEPIFPDNDIPIADVTDIKLVMKYNEAPIATGNFRAYGFQETARTFSAQGGGTSGDDNDFRLTEGVPTLSDNKLVSPFVSFEKIAGASDGTFTAYELLMRVTFEDVKVMNLFYGGRGRTDDGLSTGDVIENSADVTKSVIEDVIGATNADAAAFTAAALVSDINFAFGLHTKQVKANKVLAELGSQGHSKIWGKPDGTESIKVIKRTYSESDVVAEVSWKDTKRGKPTFFLTPIKDVVTSSTVQYADYLGSLTGTTEPLNDTAARTLNGVTLAQSLKNWPANRIGALASADNLNSINLGFYKNMAIGITIFVGKKYYPLDVGDVIKYTDVPHKLFGLDITIEETIAGQTIYPYFMIDKVLERSNQIIGFLSHQLRDAS